MEDEYEMPVKITLYRQSSIETCSSPSHLTKKSFDNTEDEKDVLPRITDITIKKHSAANVRNEITKEMGNSRKEYDKNEFLNTLEQKLVASSLIHSDIQDRGRKENEGELGQPRTSRIIEATALKQNDPNVNNKPKSSKIKKNTNQMVFIKDLEEKMLLKSSTPESGTFNNTKNQATPKPIPVPRIKRSTLVENVTKSAIPKIRELTPNCANTGNIHNENDVDLIDSDKTIVFENEPELESRKYTPVSLLKALKMKSNVSGATDTIIENVYNVSTENHRPQMASTTRPKSPKPIITKTDKEESFWDKIGTLGRKKRFKEVQEVQAEGKYAIDSPGYAPTPILPPEEYDLDENEERSLIVSKTYEDEKLQNLMQVLIDWINDELASQRIIVQDLAEDLYDGQVLQKLFEMVTGRKLDVPEVTQSEEGQKQKLAVVLAHFNKVLGYPNNISKEWNVEAIHSKNIVSILHLLVALARHFRPPVRLPENVSISVDVVQKVGGQLSHRVVREKITTEYDDVGMRCERDAFDTLFDHAPDKLQVVKKSMVTFVNKHLNKLNLEVTEIETQFHDGVYLIMLMGLLEGFFVPLYSFYATPKDNDQKVHNVSFAFELMEEVGLARPKARPEDVVNLDLKSTLRVLYNLFNKYKSLL